MLARQRFSGSVKIDHPRLVRQSPHGFAERRFHFRLTRCRRNILRWTTRRAAQVATPVVTQVQFLGPVHYGHGKQVLQNGIRCSRLCTRRCQLFLTRRQMPSPNQRAMDGAATAEAPVQDASPYFLRRFGVPHFFSSPFSYIPDHKWQLPRATQICVPGFFDLHSP